ncbi:MAG TPA: type II toxin-antitoxin system VapC family toxin [Anaerolineae bacterium]|nr:type II toxin-antitoxin system VapC family toxin [Anaerolineae bacterium]
MIVYLDASALVKRYVAERGSDEVARLIAAAAGVGTSLISRAETSAALAKAVRVGALTREAAAAALQVFRSEWPLLIRMQATEPVLARADALAWELGLRGYDAVHLASALIWQEGVGEAVTLATFDRQLWDAARAQGQAVFPEDLPAWLNG